MYLATRKGADPALADRLLKYLERGVAREEEVGRWKQIEYGLLIALDRPKDLEKAPAKLDRAGDAGQPLAAGPGLPAGRAGPRSRGHQAAGGHRGRRRAGPAGLPHPGRLVSGRQPARAVRAGASVAALQGHGGMAAAPDCWPPGCSPGSSGNGHPPTAVDQDVLFQFAALLEKSSNPQHHLGCSAVSTSPPATSACWPGWRTRSWATPPPASIPSWPRLQVRPRRDRRRGDRGRAGRPPGQGPRPGEDGGGPPRPRPAGNAGARGGPPS